MKNNKEKIITTINDIPKRNTNNHLPLFTIPREIFQSNILNRLDHRKQLAAVSLTCTSFFHTTNNAKLKEESTVLADYSAPPTEITIGDGNVLAMALSPDESLWIVAFKADRKKTINELFSIQEAKTGEYFFSLHSGEKFKYRRPHIELAITQDNKYLIASYHYWRTYWDDTPPPLPINQHEFSCIDIWDLEIKKHLHRFNNMPNLLGGKQLISLLENSKENVHKFLVAYYGQGEDQWNEEPHPPNIPIPLYLCDIQNKKYEKFDGKYHDFNFIRNKQKCLLENNGCLAHVSFSVLKNKPYFFIQDSKSQQTTYALQMTDYYPREENLIRRVIPSKNENRLYVLGNGKARQFIFPLLSVKQTKMVFEKELSDPKNTELPSQKKSSS